MAKLARLPFVLLAFATAAYARNHEFEYDLRPGRDFQTSMEALFPLAPRFFREVRLGTVGMGRIDRVAYGTPEFGYLVRADFTTDKSSVRFGFVPPTFRSPIEFWVREAGKRRYRRLRSERFSSPFPEWSRAIPTKAEGTFTANFFLLNGALVDPQTHFPWFFPMIVNKWGEIVWAHLPAEAKRLIPTYFVFKSLGRGRYAALAPRYYSYFETFDLSGKVWGSEDPRRASPPFVLHHDFVFEPARETFLTLGFADKTLRDCTPILGAPAADDPCRDTPLRVLANSILRFRAPGERADVIWNAFEFLSFDRNEDWTLEGFFHLDGKVTAESLRRALPEPKAWLSWSENAHTDWMHANALAEIPGKGYLVSLRNFNKLLLVAPDGKRVLWTIGPDASDTYRVSPADQFRGQHHASWTSRETILVFDNHNDATVERGHAGESRILEIALKGNETKAVWEFKPSPPLLSNVRGSAYDWPQNRIVAYFPSEVSGTDSVLEIDRTTRKPVGTLSLTHGPDWMGYRAEPVQALAGEEFVRRLPGK